jgi:hypothetical protein
VRQHPHLYEVNTRPWLHELSQRHGRTVRLGDVPEDEWDALAAHGFDLLYLMGVWQRSAFGRRQSRTEPAFFADYDRVLPGWTMDDVLGSPFAVQDYRPDPAVGGWEDLAALRSALHARGMGLVLDLVPNHTAPDHPWVTSRPHCYVVGGQDDFRRDPSAFHLVEAEVAGTHRFVARGRDPHFAAWPDTAQLDYSNPATRSLMQDTIRNLAAACDGLRCDMAMLLLPDVFARTWGHLVTEPVAEEFWQDAVGANPGVLFIAEVYWGLEHRLQDLGFHYTYDKALYDHVTAGAVDALRQHLQTPPERQAGLVRFLENHDEPRSNAVLGPERMEAAATLLGTVPGLRFFHHGQLEGRTRRLPVRLLRTAEEPPDPVVVPLLQRLLRITDHPDFHEGRWRLLKVSPIGPDDTLIAYTWEGGEEDRVVVVNMGGQTAEGTVLLESLPTAGRIDVLDDLHDRVYPWNGEDLAGGLYVRLDAHRAHVLRLRPTV